MGVEHTRIDTTPTSDGRKGEPLSRLSGPRVKSMSPLMRSLPLSLPSLVLQPTCPRCFPPRTLAGLARSLYNTPPEAPMFFYESFRYPKQNQACQALPAFPTGPSSWVLTSREQSASAPNCENCEERRIPRTTPCRFVSYVCCWRWADEQEVVFADKQQCDLAAQKGL